MMSSVRLGQGPSGSVPLEDCAKFWRPGPVRIIEEVVNSLAPGAINPLLQSANMDLARYRFSLFKVVEKLFAEGKIRDRSMDLMHAAKVGDSEQVRILLSRPIFPAEELEDALLCAIKNGHPEVRDLLLARKKDMELWRRETYFEIISAALCGDLDEKKMLAEESILGKRYSFAAPPTKKPYDFAVEYAALGGQIEVAERLLVTGKISLAGLQKALWIASVCGHLKIVQSILFREEMAGQGLEHVLECTNEGHQVEVVRLLVDKGIISTDNRSRAVRLAVIHGYSEIVELLLDAGPISAEALYQASQNAAAQGFLTIVRLLLSKRDIAISWKTPPSKAVAHCHLFILESFLFTDDPYIHVNIDLKNLVSRNELEIVRLLLSREGVGRNDLDGSVLIAAENGHLECLQLLLSAGDIGRMHRGNAISRAAENGHLECLQLLLSAGDIHISDRGYAVSKAAENGRLECLRLLLSIGDIDISDRGYAVSKAAENGYLECLRLLLSTRDIDSNHRGNAVKRALLSRHLGVVLFLLRDAAGNFIDIPPHTRDEIVMELSRAGFLEGLELFLQNTPPRSISTSARDSAITQATGPQRDAIRDMFRMIETYDDRVAERSAAMAAAGILSLPSWEDLRKKPLDYLRQATEIKFRRVSFGEDKAIDLGGVSKQFITILIDSLIAKGDLEIDPIFRLPVQTNEKQKQTLELLGKFLSHIHQRNKERNDKLLIGPRFAIEFFILLREGLTEGAKSECLKAIIRERNDPHTEFLVGLMDNSEDEVALTNYKDVYGYETTEEAKVEFLARKSAIFSALDFIRRHLEGALKENVKGDPWDLSLQLQGQLVSKEALLHALRIESPGSDPVFTGMVEWLKEWIGQADEEALKAFLKAITGRDSMAGHLEISIKQSWREDKAFEFHSCCNSLDLPKLAALPPKDDFLAALVNVIQGEGYNIA